MNLRLGYLGPPGTFSEEAALRYIAGRPHYLVPYPGIDLVVAAVERQEIGLGVVPVENSLEGSVNLTFDLLRESSVQIRGEIALPVRHFLLAPQGETLSGIKEIYSHPQALAQCRRSLVGLLPGVPARAAASTAEAAARAARQGPGGGAVASRRAAWHYGLDILKEDLQDEGGNVTRFLVLGDRDASPTGDDKTSLLLGLPDKPGSLHGLLGILAQHKLNLTKIESRPLRGDLGKYIFFLDFQGHRQDEKVAAAIRQMHQAVLFVKVLGSYPRAGTR